MLKTQGVEDYFIIFAMVRKFLDIAMRKGLRHPVELHRSNDSHRRRSKVWNGTGMSTSLS